MARRLIVMLLVCAAGVAAADRTDVRPERTLDSIAAGKLPAGWSGTRDRATGVVAELWGGTVPAPNAVADASAAERAARGFLSANIALLAPGATGADFVVVANSVGRGLRTVGFQQTYRGVPVVTGQVAVMIENDRVFAATSQALPDVRADISAPRTRGVRVVLPIDGGYRAADEIDVRGGVLYLAPDGTPLLGISRVRTSTGTLAFDVPVRYPAGGRHDVPASEVGLTADGVATTTDTAGGFAWAGGAAASVVPSTTGPRIAVSTADGALATATLTAPPGATTVWSEASDEYGDAELSAFVFATIAKHRAREIVPAIAAYLDQTLSVTVNEGGEECNAMSTGDDIHFDRASALCENTARIADIVEHEFGHSMHAHAIIPGAGQFTGALSEGIADYFAATITGDSGLGRGLRRTGDAERDIDPIGFEAAWPRDRSGDNHLTGLILSGALWDLRKKLAPAQMDAIFAGVIERSPDIPGSYLAARIADDDDGDLGNGTPHACELAHAFGIHGLAPGFQTTGVGAPIVDGTTLTVPTATVQGTGCPQPQVTSVEVRYRIGANASAFLLAAAGPDAWTGAFPALPDGTIVRYSVRATLDDDTIIVYPENAADPEYTLVAGDPALIWCEHFDAAPDWRKQGADDWTWGPPPPLSIAGGPTSTFRGAAVFGTDLTGDGRYSMGATSAVLAPAVDTAGTTNLHLLFRRWLTVEDGGFDQATISANGQEVWRNPSLPIPIDFIDREWRLVDVDLSAFAGQPIELSFGLTSDASRQLGGWNLDEVCLVDLDRPANGLCGNGRLDEGEQCDNAAANGGENAGCTARCTLATDEPGCCSSGGAPGGPLALAILVLGLYVRRRT